MSRSMPFQTVFTVVIPFDTVYPYWDPTDAGAYQDAAFLVKAIRDAGIAPEQFSIENGAALRMIFTTWTEMQQAAVRLNAVLDLLHEAKGTEVKVTPSRSK